MRRVMRNPAGSIAYVPSRAQTEFVRTQLRVTSSVRFPSMKEFIRIEVKGSPLADMLSDEAMQVLTVESERALAEFVVPSGEIIMPICAHIVTANKR